jgi:hypothetical protein
MAKERYTAQQVIDAITGSGGIQAVVAAKLGCDRATISLYAKRYKTVRDALDQAEEELTDLAESKHVTRIRDGYWPAIQYRLSTKGRRRGYGEQVDVTSGGVSLAELMRQVIADRHEEDTGADEAEQAGDTVPAEPTRQSG